ncbi:MAG: 16S rRNA (guanine(527)-N(7))-methyltransferase RsmG [Hyphomonadaceae bacterium]
MSAYDSTRFRIDAGVSQETAERLLTHERLLAAWAPRINLIGPGELEHYWRRHALDSAQLLRHAPANANLWLDLGSGAGFPGLVVAVCLAERGEGVRVDLVEQNAKRAAFLREAVRETGAPARVLHQKLEALSPGNPEQSYDVCTARALAPLKRLILSAKPWLDRGAVGLFPKGADYASELAEAGFAPVGGASGLPEFEGLTADVLESLSDPRARIVRIRRTGELREE